MADRSTSELPPSSSSSMPPPPPSSALPLVAIGLAAFGILFLCLTVAFAVRLARKSRAARAVAKRRATSAIFFDRHGESAPDTAAEPSSTSRSCGTTAPTAATRESSASIHNSFNAGDAAAADDDDDASTYVIQPLGGAALAIPSYSEVKEQGNEAVEDRLPPEARRSCSGYV